MSLICCCLLQTWRVQSSVWERITPRCKQKKSIFMTILGSTRQLGLVFILKIMSVPLDFQKIDYLRKECELHTKKIFELQIQVELYIIVSGILALPFVQLYQRSSFSPPAISSKARKNPDFEFFKKRFNVTC